MSGQRFFIREVLYDLGSRLVNISSESSLDECQKVDRCLREIKLAAHFLEKVNRGKSRLTQSQLKDYMRARDSVLVYLLYYDRLQRFLGGDATPGDWSRPDLFKAADYTDWKTANQKATRLFAIYVRFSAELVGV